MTNNYWENRQANIQAKLLKKSEKKIQKQLANYYAAAARSTIADFEATYDKILAAKAAGKEPTPADLYRLDKFWQMQGQLRERLRKLGEKQVALLTKEFELAFFDVYYALEIEGATAFSTLDKAGVQQMINSVWMLDGKSFSQRVWDNVERLVDTLNEQLILTVSTGKKTTELKNLLQERFGVSYSRANTLVRTELCHIQTVAAKQRYEDYGLTKYKILGNDKDNCGNHSVDCHEMDGKVFLYSEMTPGKNAPPFHPNCKCCIVPVVE